MLWRVSRRVYMTVVQRPQMIAHIPHGVEFEFITKSKMDDNEIWREMCFTNFS